jgi:hypothetical protein
MPASRKADIAVTMTLNKRRLFISVFKQITGSESGRFISGNPKQPASTQLLSETQ